MLSGKRVLVVEDDKNVCEVIKATLQMQHMQVDLAHNGYEGQEKALQGNYDLVILDIMLPRRDGLEVCKNLRVEGFDMPVLMLTARVSEVDKVLGLELGADDYITKPFSPRELVARCKSALRRFIRSSQTSQDEIRYKEVVIQPEQYKVFINDQQVEFTPKEFELLTFFARHPKQTFTRDHLLDQVWGFESISETRTIDEHVKRIRSKLKGGGCKTISIKTIWGVGYQFEVEDNV